MKILLDTNFIISCARQKIDFETLANEIISEKIDWIVPQEVLNELGRIKDSPNSSKKDKLAARISFEILQKLNPQIIELKGNNPNIDIRIINYVLGKDIVVATLDKELKNKIDNKVLTIRNKRYIELLE